MQTAAEEEVASPLFATSSEGEGGVLGARRRGDVHGSALAWICGGDAGGDGAGKESAVEQARRGEGRQSFVVISKIRVGATRTCAVLATRAVFDA